jgi:hypothetical protein
MRISKSFTLESDVSEYLDETKGDRSASERANELLRRAMLLEQCEKLEAEAKDFFSSSKAGRTESKAFQKASFRTLTRDEW